MGFLHWVRTNHGSLRPSVHQSVPSNNGQQPTKRLTGCHVPWNTTLSEGGQCESWVNKINSKASSTIFQIPVLLKWLAVVSCYKLIQLSYYLHFYYFAVPFVKVPPRPPSFDKRTRHNRTISIDYIVLVYSIQSLSRAGVTYTIQIQVLHIGSYFWDCL